MIDLLVNNSTPPAYSIALAATAVLKVGSQVPCSVTFAQAPGTITTMAIALGSNAVPSAILAYNEMGGTNGWVQESETEYTCILDCTDARLVAYMAELGNTNVLAELSMTVDGELIICPNVPVTVQPAIVTGPTTSDEGPTYVTTGALATALAGYLQIANKLSELTPYIATVLGNLGIKADGAFIKYGVVSPADAAVTIPVAFTTAYGAAPLILLGVLVAPAGQPIVECILNKATLGVGGGTFELGAALPAGGYQLFWVAILA